MTAPALPIRRRDRAPWSPRAWRQALYLTGGIPALLIVPFFIVAGFAVRPRWVLPLLFLVVALLAMPLLGQIHRHRLRATAGVVIPPQPIMPNGLSLAAIEEAIRSPVTWRQAGYHFLAAPALAAAALAAFGTWLAGLLYSLVYVYAWTLSPQNLLARGQSSGPPGHLAPMSSIPVDAYLTAAGLLLLVAAPWLTAGIAALDARAASALLGPSRAEELEHRVEHLTQTRAGAVDAADAERRRLERNLHDGTQQRLVSLAMNLGMARAQTETVEEAHEAIAEAHEEAKAALAELRNLIRGLHPPVLENRGLDAADLSRRHLHLAAVALHGQAGDRLRHGHRAGRDGLRLGRDVPRAVVQGDQAGAGEHENRRGHQAGQDPDPAARPGGPTLLTVDLPCAR